MCLLDQQVIGEGFQGALYFRRDSGALQRWGCAGLGEELFSSLGMTATMELPFLHKLWHATNSLICVKSNYYEGWNFISSCLSQKGKKIKKQIPAESVIFYFSSVLYIALKSCKLIIVCSPDGSCAESSHKPYIWSVHSPKEETSHFL